MLPKTRQRLLVLLAVLVGGAAWVWPSSVLLAADGSTGISLLSARWHPVAATAFVVVTGVPALLLALVAAAAGNPILGVLASALALCILAGYGGSMHGWLERQEALSGAYAELIAEVLIWQAGVLLLLLLIRRARPALRRGWPALAFDDRADGAFALRLTRPWSVGAGLVCAVVAAAVGFFLIRKGDSGQVLGSLLVAFTLGGLAAGAAFPGCNPLGLLFSPALVAIGAYAWVLLRLGDDPEQIRAAWHIQEGAGGGTRSLLPGLALALPIHYASAGLAGCCIGIGLGGSSAAGDDDEQASKGGLAGLWRRIKVDESGRSDAVKPTGKGRRPGGA